MSWLSSSSGLGPWTHLIHVGTAFLGKDSYWRDGMWVNGGGVLLRGMKGILELKPIPIQLSRDLKIKFYFRTGHMT